MPIINRVDDRQRIVYTTCEGKMELADFKIYVQNIWSHGLYYGYNELFDARQGDWEEFDFGNLFVVASDAAKLASLDPNSKLAWVILEGKQKRLTDFYTSLKTTLTDKSRELRAFYSEQEALDWLTGSSKI